VSASGGYAASLLPGCWVVSENVGIGDASVGVARNPLRDGAPPTRLAPVNEAIFPSSIRRRVHEAPCRTSSLVVSEASDLGHRRATFAPHDCGDGGVARASAFVETKGKPRFKDGRRMRTFSPRAASMRNGCWPLPRIWAAGLVVPRVRARSNFRSIEVEGSVSCPLVHWKRDPFVRFVSLRNHCRVETRERWHVRSRRSVACAARANVRVPTAESEATSESGSSRRTRPRCRLIEGNSSRERLDIASGHAFFRTALRRN